MSVYCVPLRKPDRGLDILGTGVTDGYVLALNFNWRQDLTMFPGWPGTVYVAQGDLYLYVAQANLELTVLLPQPPNSWDYRNMSHARFQLYISSFSSF